MSNSYLDTKFQYYPSDIRVVKPLGDITLYDYLYKIKNPTEQTVNLFKQIEEASSVGDLKLKAELKAKTYYFTPCIFSDGQGRSYSNIKSWTGLMGDYRQVYITYPPENVDLESFELGLYAKYEEFL